jgi:hypothetical protein
VHNPVPVQVLQPAAYVPSVRQHVPDGQLRPMKQGAQVAAVAELHNDIQMAIFYPRVVILYDVRVFDCAQQHHLREGSVHVVRGKVRKWDDFHHERFATGLSINFIACSVRSFAENV